MIAVSHLCIIIVYSHEIVFNTASFDIEGSGLVTQAEIGSLTAQVRF